MDACTLLSKTKQHATNKQLIAKITTINPYFSIIPIIEIAKILTAIRITAEKLAYMAHGSDFRKKSE